MTSPAQGKEATRRAAVNRKARHEYEILERLEAGIALHGPEVKSVRQAHVTLGGGYVRIDEGQAILHDVQISAYEYANRFNDEPNRPRRLLLHRKEIDRLAGLISQKGCAVIPLSVYFKKGRVKVELGVCRGRKSPDKREELRRRTSEREARREMTERRR